MGRIGVIADTHDDLVPWGQVHDKVAAAFDGVEVIVHCGDLTTFGVLDRLSEIAPVVAVRSSNDPAPEAPRLFDGPHVIETADAIVGVVNVLGEDTASSFGRPVDVILHGGTHVASVDDSGPILLVNPGSPTLADQVSVAVVETGGERPKATIVPL
jgi:putative phosphoesterase